MDAVRPAQAHLRLVRGGARFQLAPRGPQKVTYGGEAVQVRRLRLCLHIQEGSREVRLLRFGVPCQSLNPNKYTDVLFSGTN